MDLDAFSEEANKLAREGFLLREEGQGAPVAYWHGLDADGPILSLKQGAKWLNIIIDDDLEGSTTLSEQPLISGTPLFSEPYLCLPPVEGVYLKGSEKIGSYLKKHDWEREEPHNSNFPDPVPEQYNSIWQNNYPLYSSNIAVVTGGWHMPWPDDDWIDFVDHKLVACTLKDSEPWVEVFQNGNEYIVKQRTT